jgi:hypothetical protein
LVVSHRRGCCAVEAALNLVDGADTPQGETFRCCAMTSTTPSRRR